METKKTAVEEEKVPLQGKMRQTVGISQATLVSDGTKAYKVPQYIAALIVTIGGLAMGTILGWTSPTELPLKAGQYGFEVNNSEFPWIGSLMSIGAIFGAAFTGTITDKIGRRTTIIGIVIPSVVGWALMIWAVNPYMMMVGRVILGLASGAYSVACPMYTNEISEVEIRGTLGTYFQLQITIGILLSYVIGAVVDVYWLSVICAIIPILTSVLMAFMPETPYYLLMKNDVQKARQSLQKLRGKKYNIDGEIEQFQATIERVAAEKLSFRQAFTTVAAKRGLAVGLGIMFFQQLSGINAVIFYTSQIFQSAGSKLAPSVATIIVGAVSVVATYVSTLMVDRLGRKPLLFISDLVMALSSLVLGIFFWIQTHEPEKATSIGWLPIACLSVFIIVFSIGYGPIPWMLIAEIFSPAIKGPASSIACLFNWVCAFLVTLLFPIVKDAIGSATTFWIFTVISFIGTAFVYFFVPETKGKSLDEVVKIFGGSSSSSSDATIEASGEKRH
ncbi:facilitated trehalose transporter Tret1-like isoform X2 [Rhodnius prolixus]|uniref:facilitated trehalose transporter Tret1-like isoform X2 n=1 Tax=Rhodnius prolixus TaxID=13249 RepID=UPI003D18D326